MLLYVRTQVCHQFPECSEPLGTLVPCSCASGEMNCAGIHVFSDAGLPTYMYEFQYRPSFSSDMKPERVTGDHGDELFSVFGAPFLKGDGPLVTTNLEFRDLGSSLEVGWPWASSSSLGLSFPNSNHSRFELQRLPVFLLL